MLSCWVSAALICEMCCPGRAELMDCLCRCDHLRLIAGSDNSLREMVALNKASAQPSAVDRTVLDSPHVFHPGCDPCLSPSAMYCVRSYCFVLCFPAARCHPWKQSLHRC